MRAPFFNRELNGMSVSRTSLTSVLLLLCSSSAVAVPAESKERSRSEAMPEPVLGESVTEIDGTEAGEIELDLTAVIGRTGGTNLWQASVEIESRVIDRLGLELELGYSDSFTSNVPDEGSTFGCSRPGPYCTILRMDSTRRSRSRGGSWARPRRASTWASRVFPTPPGFGSASTGVAGLFGWRWGRRRVTPALT